MRLITDILREYRKGAIVTLATDKLAEIVRAVDQTGKGGELIIKIKINPSKDGSAEKTLVASLVTKLPIPDMQPAVFFSDTGGDLHRVDPAQKEIEFSAAPARTNA